MTRTISLSIAGELKANLCVLNRKNIYGERKIIPVDKDQQECKKAYSDENGKILIPSGGTAFYKDKESTDRTDFSYVQTSFSSNEEENAYTSFEKINRCKKINRDNICGTDLLLKPKAVYRLEGFDQYNFENRIGEDIYAFNFVYKRKGPVYPAHVFCRQGTTFLVVYNQDTAFGNWNFLEKGQVFQTDDEELAVELDDIDFDMF